MYTKRIHPMWAGVMVLAFGQLLLSQTTQNPMHGTSTTDPAPSVQQAATQSGAASNASYVIGEDDVLGINVWNEPNLKQPVPVRPDGKISLPLVGDIQAAGRTPGQLQQDIAARLQNFINHPDVTVIVQQINSKKYNVLGRVMKPGAYSLSTTTTVLDAIAQAGGFQDFAKQKDIYILRRVSNGGDSRLRFNYKEVIKGKNLEQNIKLEPNDTIVVP